MSLSAFAMFVLLSFPVMPGAMRQWARRAASAVSDRWIPLVFIGTLGLPAVLLILRRDVIPLDDFAGRPITVDGASDVVAALLHGEHLVAPAPLPPDMFTTRDVIRVRPAIATASREWNLIDDMFAQRLLQVFRLMKDRHGYDMVLLEGYRSPERQNELAAGASHVTNAAAWQSYHQYGLAADSAFLKNGRVVISEKDPWAMRGYRLFGELASAAGLTWGGHWRLADFGHVELRQPDARRQPHAP